MKHNSVSVRAHLVNGELVEILDNALPMQAIRDYLLPGATEPVQEFIIKVRTHEGRMISIYLNSNRVDAVIIGSAERRLPHAALESSSQSDIQ